MKFACLAVLTLSCLLPSAVLAQAPAEAPAADPIPHLLSVAEGVFSGAQPRGEQDFATLAKMGVKTIVSVDGVRPDIEAAKKHGLRYIHIPFGYDGVDDHATESLTRVARETQGPVYVHCHHGKHRGPAAAAIICLASGDFHRAEAEDYMERAGTSSNYAGLWRSIRTYQTPPQDAELPELVAVAKVDGLTEYMARMGRAADELKLARAARWQAPADHPDLVPAHQALLLQEGLRESLRQLDDAQRQAYGEAMQRSETLADGLVTAIQNGDTAAADRKFQAVITACGECHRDHRN
ncbi:phosphatase domain-containing protein [Roseimaritima ulvae]|uniref:Swiss Army Knife protein DSP-PTPase phosphatase domain-containing protein n=1 Tax=Roseimaritima ulvae TaxID=980254 RepID=A0A5B9QLI6_9BACT|nr:tyrosine-protein phosphatase [Roseimaritima ulvae]QEG39937.1 hypothetical protein UC8_19390 [Roseimaritima ulvae]